MSSSDALSAARSQRREADQKDDRGVARIARVRAERPPHEQHGHDGAGHPEDGPLEHVPVATVPELMRDDEPHLRRPRALEQRVVEDNAARPPEAADVGVDLLRPTARIRHEDLAHRHAGPRR